MSTVQMEPARANGPVDYRLLSESSEQHRQSSVNSRRPQALVTYARVLS